MQLPPALLNRIRLTVGVSALVVPGCDAANGLVGGERSSGEPAAVVASREDAEAARDPDGAQDDRGGSDLGAQVAAALAAAEPSPQPEARTLPEPEPTSPEPVARPRIITRSTEEVTAFIPFSGDPTETVEPCDPKPPRRRQASTPTVAPSKSTVGPKTEWNCPACGRG